MKEYRDLQYVELHLTPKSPYSITCIFVWSDGLRIQLPIVSGWGDILRYAVHHADITEEITPTTEMEFSL